MISWDLEFANMETKTHSYKKLSLNYLPRSNERMSCKVKIWIKIQCYFLTENHESWQFIKDVS